MSSPSTGPRRSATTSALRGPTQCGTTATTFSPRRELRSSRSRTGRSPSSGGTPSGETASGFETCRGTTPHLHCEVHPVELLWKGYDGVVNPYPYLLAWKRQTDLSFDVGAWSPL